MFFTNTTFKNIHTNLKAATFSTAGTLWTFNACISKHHQKMGSFLLPSSKAG